MIRQRTKEGLRMRVKLGVLVGRPGGVMEHSTNACCLEDKKEQVIEQYKWGVPDRRLAENFGVDRATIVKWLHRWGVRNCPSVDKIEAQDNVGKMALEYGKERAEGIDMKKLTILIEGDLTIPEIARQFSEYTYEQVYGTILCTKELNLLYRKHGQKKVLKKKR